MRTKLVVIGTIVAAVVATAPSFASLLHFWLGIHDYQYGLPLVVIAAVWTIQVARRLPDGVSRPCWPGSLLLAGALLAWLVVHSANSLIGHQVLMPVVIWLAVLAAAGWRSARPLLAPVAFLYFTIPVWDYAVPLLQRMSVAATEGMLSLAGVPAQVHEYQVTLPSGSFQIVEGCSGKRYFMATLAIAYLAAAMQQLTAARALVFVIASGVLALLANWIRIFVVIVAGHFTNMRHYLVAVEHESFGNVIFVLLLAVVLLLAWKLRAVPRPAGPSVPSPRREDHAGHGFQRVGALVPVVLLACAFAVVQARAIANEPSPALGPPPLSVADWQGPVPPEPQWMPSFQSPADQRRVAYMDSLGRRVEVYVNLYGEQRPGAELVYYLNTLLAPGPWSRPWPPRGQALGPAEAMELMAYEAAGPEGGSWVIAYGYVVGRYSTTHGAVAQLLYGLQSVLRPVPSGMVALAMPCDPNCEETRALVASFWNEMSLPVLGMIPRPGTAERMERP